MAAWPSTCTSTLGGASLPGGYGVRGWHNQPCEGDAYEDDRRGVGGSGSYFVAEHRDDGTLVLEPERERLSEVIAQTERQVLRDDEFIVHLERVATAEDDLPPGEGE